MKSVALFDLDGTLVNADHLHYEAWKHMLSPHGIDLTEESYRTDVMGSPNSLLLKSLLKDLDEKAGLALIDDKEAMFRRLFVKVEPARGLTVFLDWLSGQGVPVGVVTNAPRANAEHQLQGLGLVKRFPLVVIGAEVDAAFMNAGPGFVWREPGDVKGGHAMVVVGYDDEKAAFKILNSWGSDWGDRGCGWIAYARFATVVKEAYVVKEIMRADDVVNLAVRSM